MRNLFEYLNTFVLSVTDIKNDANLMSCWHMLPSPLVSFAVASVSG